MPLDDLSDFLISGGTRRSLSPERLEMMGKEAAQLFIDKGVPLSTSIVKIAGAESDINAEQVKRICEFANTAVYLSHHAMNKTAGSETSYPQFELADPSQVTMQIFGAPKDAVSVDISYSQRPEQTKTASAKLEGALAELFGADKEKTAAVSVESAAVDVMEAKDHLASLIDNLSDSLAQLETMHKEASDAYYTAVRTHLMEGESFTDVVNAAAHAGVDPSRSVPVLTSVTQRLIEEKIASIDQLEVQNTNEELDKVAHRVVDLEHPLVNELRAICEIDEEREKVAAAVEEVKAQLGVVQSFIRENFLHAPRAS